MLSVKVIVKERPLPFLALTFCFNGGDREYIPICCLGAKWARKRTLVVKFFVKAL